MCAAIGNAFGGGTLVKIGTESGRLGQRAEVHVRDKSFWGRPLAPKAGYAHEQLVHTVLAKRLSEPFNT